MTIHPDPDNEVDRKLRVEVGGVIMCTANGRPEPTYNWYNEDNSLVIPGQVLTITRNMVRLILDLHIIKL